MAKLSTCVCLQGFEINGLEHLPASGPALIIYYHAVIPIDMYYVMAKCLLEKGRMIHAVGDNFLFHIPGEWQGLSLLFVLFSFTVVRSEMQGWCCG